MRFVPIDDKILVRRALEESRSPGGIIVPDAARGRAFHARVLAVGPGRMTGSGARLPVDAAIRPGVDVVLKRHVGKEVPYDGAPATVVGEADVLAVLER